MQKIQAYRLTENNGSVKQLPLGVTTLRSLAIGPGDYDMTTTESSAFTDHPEPGVAGWRVTVSSTDSTGSRIVTMRRKTGNDLTKRTYETNVQSDGTFTKWQIISTGAYTWTNIPLHAALAAVGWSTPQCTLVEGGTFVALLGSFTISAYVGGMTIGTLPLGFRPTATRRLGCGIDDNANGNTMIGITSDGNIKLDETVAAAKKVMLDGLRFPI